MGKVLIASFDGEEEQDFEELVLFLKEKGYRDFTSMNNQIKGFSQLRDVSFFIFP